MRLPPGGGGGGTWPGPGLESEFISGHVKRYAVFILWRLEFIYKVFLSYHL